ncbi:MAG: PEP-CTERM sorting domain-containing protein, partial [Opitutaceae bacterium]
SYAPNSGSTVEMIGFGGGVGESWGNNTIYGYSGYTLDGYGYGGAGIVTLASGENGNGAQGILGDSGGGMFYQTSGGTWELLGTLSGVGEINNGPGTVAVDLPEYASQITTDIDSVAIPEPSTYAAFLSAAALCFATIRRRRVLDGH